MFSDDQKKQLSAKLDASNVKSRSQAGRSLSYVEGWHVIAEANRIFGFDGWHRETVELKQVHEPYQNDKSNWVVGYMAKVKILVGSVVREGCGFGSGIDRDLGRAHESALKEAETDAMKRGFMTFGNPFGLALYDKTQENVETAAPAKQPPAPTSAPPKPAPAPTGKPKLGDWIADRKAEIDQLRSPKAFSTWWQTHEEKLKQLESSHPHVYESMVQHFSNAQVRLAAA